MNIFANVRAELAGLTPEHTAKAAAIGVALGVCPLFGLPTALSLLAARRLNLRFAAVQAFNSASTPLQVALLVPLVDVGRWLCGGTASGARHEAVLAIYALAGWACICLPLGVLAYAALLRLARVREQ